jgi:lysophospholipase L1-like esterase
MYMCSRVLLIIFLSWTVTACSSNSAQTDAGPDGLADAFDAGADDEPAQNADDGGQLDDGGDEASDGDAGGDQELDAGGDQEFDAGDSPADSGADAGDGDQHKLTASECWAHKNNPEEPGPEYDQFDPIIGSHCMGTNHQDIDGVELVVFLGDSITAGTPPTPMSQFYRYVLTGLIEDKFGEVETRNHAEWGARTDDLLLPSKQQIINAFPNLPEEKRTLVVMTVGGNDFFKMAEMANEGATPEEIMDLAIETVQLFEDAINWFFEDPSRFPNGVFIVFANVFEYTDGTGNMSSCPSCLIVGLCGDWPEGRAPAIYLNESYMRIAKETGTDMIFLLENFCGHGWESDIEEGQCYLGPDTPRWIDITCIHPTPEGHQEIADMFWKVIDE